MRKALASLLLLTTFVGATAQIKKVEEVDEENIVRLIKAKSASSRVVDSIELRVVKGDAQFLHNGALIVCDSAVWDLTANRVDAEGNVKIYHEDNTLSSDKIIYEADSSLAKVRGRLVELIDKSGNRLRTRYLNYNTRDSIAHFFNGGSMRDTSGNHIESLKGYFYAKIDMFKFLEEVEMEGDEILIKSDSLAYWAESERVDFLGKLYGWQEEGFLTSNKGWYLREREIYSFSDNAYLNNDNVEVWADSLLYRHKLSEAQLFTNVQIEDSTQSVILFGDYAEYREEPFESLLHTNPSIAHYSFENEKPDTLFFAADTLKYYTLKYSSLDSSFLVESERRLKESRRDYLKEMYPAHQDSSLKPLPSIDTIPIEDTTTIRFLYANRNGKFYRSDIQGRCDSLRFNSLDSIIRLYLDPVIWHESNQFNADSILILTHDNKLKKADLLSNSFVIAKMDEEHFNHIKAADVVAWFDEGELSRFDSFGGVTRLFFFEEDSIITMMNRMECRVMSAQLEEQEVSVVYSFENIKSDIHPIDSLRADEKRIQGMMERYNERATSRFDVSNRRVRKSIRKKMEAIEPPLFNYSKLFFKEEREPLPDI